MGKKKDFFEKIKKGIKKKGVEIKEGIEERAKEKAELKSIYDATYKEEQKKLTEEKAMLDIEQVRERAIERARNPPMKKFAKAVKEGTAAIGRGAVKGVGKLKEMQEAESARPVRRTYPQQRTQTPPLMDGGFGSGTSDLLFGGGGVNVGSGSFKATDMLLGGVGFNEKKKGKSRKKGKSQFSTGYWF